MRSVFIKLWPSKKSRFWEDILQQIAQDACPCSPRYFSIWLFPVHLRLAHLLNNNSNKVSYILAAPFDWLKVYPGFHDQVEGSSWTHRVIALQGGVENKLDSRIASYSNSNPGHSSQEFSLLSTLWPLVPGLKKGQGFLKMHSSRGTVCSSNIC